MNTKYIECACYSSEHTLRFCYDPDENELHVEVYLNQYHSIPERIWIAIKYIFGYKSKYGHWDTWLLRTEDKAKLMEIINQIKDNK